ncbi:MAG TPA: MotA/TolQ/ExbB proton channel family protein [Moheibacter sp.]|nr:MotA/TolQ/ExbB proton channel family protein [Moheibacter sp.]
MEMEKNETIVAGSRKKLGGLNAPITVVILILISMAIFYGLFGQASNFEGGDPYAGNPKNFMGIIFKGGVIIPFLMSFFLMDFVFAIDRAFALKKASGKGNLSNFVHEVKGLLGANKINEAIELCDAQEGSVGNVVKEGLTTYKALANDNSIDKEQKMYALTKALEEATTLEMPALEKNTSIIATIATVGTLIALMGTVIGMIKAFFALGEGGGTPDAAKLSVGIAEALINTGTGIGASALAIIFYNMITNKIDDLTFKIDEVGMAIQQAFAKHH